MGIDNILRDEKARQLVSVDRIEHNIDATATSTNNNKSAADPSSDRYWSWNGNELTERKTDKYWGWETQSQEEMKKEAIEYILREELIRQKLSSENIMDAIKEQLQLPEKEPTIIRAAAATAGAGSSSYWDW